MKIKMLVPTLALALMTTFGCSSTGVQWYKPGVSQATFSRDKADCEDAIIASGTSEISHQVYSLEGCMEGKGYTAIPPSPQ